MPICTTCGMPHPADVTTSHHPVPCFNGCFCQQKGKSREGCIWMRTLKIPSDVPRELRRLYAMMAQGELITNRDAQVAVPIASLLPIQPKRRKSEN